MNLEVVVDDRCNDRCDEAIPLASDRLDEVWFFRIVPKGLTEFADGYIEAVVGIEGYPLTPDLLR